MMCFKYRKLIIPYSEGSLDERAKAGMEAHLARCAKCRQELEAVLSVSNMLRGMDEPAAEPASDLWAKVSARIATETPAPAPRPWLRVTQAASALATVALLAVVGLGVFHQTPNTPEQPKSEQTQMAQAPAQMDAAPKATVPTAKAVPVEKHVALKAEPEAQPMAVDQPRRDVISDLNKKKVGERLAAKPARPPATDKPTDKWVDMASADLPKDHYYSRSNPEPVDELDKLDDNSGDYASSTTAGSAVAGRMSFHSSPAPEDAGITKSNPFRVAKAADTISLNAEAGKPALGASNGPEPLRVAVSPDNTATDLAKTFGIKSEHSHADTQEETAVDALNRTEGVHIAAMFQYP